MSHTRLGDFHFLTKMNYPSKNYSYYNLTVSRIEKKYLKFSKDDWKKFVIIEIRLLDYRNS